MSARLDLGRGRVALSEGFRDGWAETIAWSIADDQYLTGRLVRRTCGVGVVGHPIGPRWVSSCRRVALHAMVGVAGISASKAGRMLNLTANSASQALALHEAHHERHDALMLPSSRLSQEVDLCREWFPAFASTMQDVVDGWVEMGGGPIIPADGSNQVYAWEAEIAS